MKKLLLLAGLFWSGLASAGGSSTILSSWNCDGVDFFLVDLTCAVSIDSLIEEGDGLELKRQQSDDPWMFFPLEVVKGENGVLIIRGEDASHNVITIISHRHRYSETQSLRTDDCDY